MSVARILTAAATAALFLAASTVPAAAQQMPEAEPAPEASGQGSVAVAAGPVLGAGFVLEGVWLAPGVASLGWDNVEAAVGYELMYRGPDGWGLLSAREPSRGVSVAWAATMSLVMGLWIRPRR